ncbi:ester cyclase [Saccharothrix sp. NPDC042600]|uniref:ester cyclase n=1 Tax=Saccharothrix TaxID=2071 RepID=UPI0033ED25CC|nr:nuclear transport factor 2 family protein [Saccharothrix mutabilis subsp. capreolus]
MTSREELLRLDDQGTQAWNRHDVDGFLDTLAEDFEWLDDAQPAPIRTRDEARQAMRQWFTAFPDMHIDVTNRVVGDEAVAGELRFTGTNTGPLELGGATIPPTGRKVDTSGTYFVKTVEGKVSQFHTHANTFGMMAQLGLVGVPA